MKQTSNSEPSSFILHPSSFTPVWRVIAIVVGALFVFAGLTKIVEFQPLRWVDPMEFARAIDNYKILPWSISVRLAFYLPWLEILCGLALIFRRLYSGALALVLALMFVFIVASIVAKARGLDITCGCFGHVSDKLSFAWHMVLDLALVALLIGLWRSAPAVEREREMTV